MGHHCHISVETRKDMEVFQSLLEDNMAETAKTIPFLNKLRVFNESLQLYADSASRPDLGFGCYYQVIGARANGLTDS